MLSEVTTGAHRDRDVHRDNVRALDAVYATGYWLLSLDRVADAAKVFRTMLHAAPSDERGWLALGHCHEQIDQPRIALELYGAGSVAARPSVRLHLARTRVLRSLGRDGDADDALEQAAAAADILDDATLTALVESEKRRTR